VSEARPRGPGRHVRQRFLTGLVLLLPLFITVWLIGVVFNLVNGTITPLVERLLRLAEVPLFDHPGFAQVMTPVIGLIISLSLIYLVGLLSTNLFGARLLRALDRLMLRIPAVRAVYGGTKQLMEALSPQGRRSFSQVVLVEYPRKGVYTLGFVTREIPAAPDTGSPAEPMAAVFLPTTPNPTSGWLAVLPRREIQTLPISVEDGVKIIVSGGIVGPPLWDRSPTAPPAADPAQS
jgi:uncharacterized membrane protein